LFPFQTRKADILAAAIWCSCNREGITDSWNSSLRLYEFIKTLSIKTFALLPDAKFAGR